MGDNSQFEAVGANDFFALLHKEQEQQDTHDEEEAQSTSQIVIFLIDAKAWLEVDEAAFCSIREAIVSKILDIGFSSHYNKVGVVLYGTDDQGALTDTKSMPFQYWWSELESPSIVGVQELHSLTPDELRGTVKGVATSAGDVFEGFSNACAAAGSAAKDAKGKTKAEPVFVVMPGDAELTVLSDSYYKGRAEEARTQLHHRGFVLVAPLATSPGAFPSGRDNFWATLQKLPRSTAPEDSAEGSGRDLGGCSVSTLRADMAAWWPITKARRARRATLRLGNSLSIPIMVTSLAKPVAKLPPYKWFDETSHEQVVSSTKFIDPSTGEPVDKNTVTTFALELSSSAAFSNVLAEFPLSRPRAEELVQGVQRGDGGDGGGLGLVHPSVTLLEFYPVDTLTLMHQVAPSQFLTYVPLQPLEGGQQREENDPQQAAVRLFLALWLAMFEQGVCATATFKSTSTSAPRLVALVPQDEDTDATGLQVQPGGFSLHVLPYTDELRVAAASCPCIPAACLPKIDAPPDPPAPALFQPAPPAAVQAAADLIGALSDDELTRFSFDNPETTFAKAALRAQVLGEDAPDRDELNMVRDYMVQQAIDQAVPVHIKDAFIQHAMGGHRTDPGAAAAGKKRAAAPAQSDADVVEHIPWKQLRANGQVKSKSSAILQQYLRHYKLKTTGKKADLVERVEQHIDSRK